MLDKTQLYKIVQITICALLFRFIQAQLSIFYWRIKRHANVFNHTEPNQRNASPFG